MVTYRSSVKFDKPATVIFVSSEQVKSKKFTFKNKAIEAEVAAIAATEQFSAENSQIFPIVHQKKIILLVGVGASKDLSSTALRIAVRKAINSTFLRSIEEVEVIPHEDSDQAIQGILEGVLIGTYSWKKYKTQCKTVKCVDAHKIFLPVPKKDLFQEIETICEGVNYARNLVNDNADVVTAEFVEKAVKDLIKGNKNIDLEILGEKEMKAKGLGLHVAVNQGSNKEPRLIIVKYTGNPKQKEYTAIIGKGMTFDTGGLNLKTSGHIETMRTDMSGSAAIVGTLKNVLALNLKKNIIFVCTMAENSIGSRAYKPGDVFRSYSGKTVEIANTDAEGRLVLADAISYLVKNYKPYQIIDVATLTGACVVALGHDYTGLMTTDDNLSRQLVHSSNATDDRVWRLPVYKELKDAVKSPIADIKNLGFAKGAAGALTGAEFLRQFTEGTKWAHLDIAGTAFVEHQERLYYGHGATGAGVRLLTHFLQNN